MSIYTDDTVKNIRVLHGSDDITANVKAGTFTCENILSDKQLQFGQCNSARAQIVTTYDLGLTGEQLVVQYGAGDTWETVGTFDVTYTAKITNSAEVRLTMYDVVKRFSVDVSDWYAGLSFPITLKAFRDNLAAYIGVQQSSAELVNDGMIVNETIAPSKLKATDVLRYIGEINGVFPHATKDGKLDWVSLGLVPVEIPKTVIQGADGVTQKEFTTAPIEKLVIRSEDGDIGVSIGTGANTYFVTANVLCYGLTETELTLIAVALFNKIEGTSYKPTSLSMKTDPTIPIGARLEYDGTTFYMLSRKTSNLLFDEIDCDGNEYMEERDDVETSIEQLRGKSNVLTRDIEQTQSRVENIESDYTTHTEFTQNAESVSFELQQIQSQLDGDIDLIYTDEAPTKENYPYWDWTGMYANDGEDIPPEIRQYDASKQVYYASDDLNFLYLPSELQKHVRTMVFDQTNLMTYRFVKIDGQFVWQELADTETAVILSRLTQVEAKADGVQSSVEEIGLKLENDYWNTFQTQSAINQKADSITSTVAATYSTKTETQTLSTQVAQTASKISLLVQSGTTETSLVLTDGCINAVADKLKVTGDMIVDGTTISKKVIANDLEITGGSINIETDTESDDVIHLKSEYDQRGYRKILNSWMYSSGFKATGFTGGVGTIIEVDTNLDGININNGADGGAFKSSTMTPSGFSTTGFMNAATVKAGYGEFGTLSNPDGQLTLTAKNNMVLSGAKVMVTSPFEVTSTSTFRGNVYKADGTSIVFVSDRNKKHDIESLQEKETADFIYSLNPVEYRFNDGDSKRLHHGLIAQEVKEAMKDRDWGLYCDIEDENEQYCGIRYDELIADLIATVKSQNERIKSLENALKGDK